MWMMPLKVFGSLHDIKGFRKGDEGETRRISSEIWQGILIYLIVYVVISMT